MDPQEHPQKCPELKPYMTKSIHEEGIREPAPEAKHPADDGRPDESIKPPDFVSLSQV